MSTLELINSMEVVEFDSNKSEIIHVSVEAIEPNLEKISSILGKEKLSNYMKENHFKKCSIIDIAPLAWEYTDAIYFNGNEFINSKEKK